MSVLHTLQIAPKSGTVKTLEDIRTFINTLAEKGFIEKEFAVFTGDAEQVRAISSWDFANNVVKSPVSKISKLAPVEDQNFENLSKDKNYGFKIHLLKSKSSLAGLGVFNETDLQDFPIFISFLSSPADFNLTKEDPGTEEFEESVINGINCVVTSDGRNSKSLWDLAQDPQNFKEFYNEMKTFFGDIEIGSFYS